MKPHELEKIRKDTECYLHGETVLLHYSCNRVYILSNNVGLHGSVCFDFAKYRDRFRCSYFVVNTSSGDWDTAFYCSFLQDLHRLEENIGCLK